MTAELRVGVLVGSNTDPDQVIRSAVGGESLVSALSRASGRTVHTVVITCVPSSDYPEGHVVRRDGHPFSLVERLLGVSILQRIYDALQRFPIGRLINSLGPLDQSRIFWRAVRKDPVVLSALQSCDVLVAADLAAVKTAWELRRKHPQTKQAYFGLGSTLKVFNSRYLQSTSP